MKQLKKELETYCELHWWNMGSKTLSFKGELKDLLKEQRITFTKKKTDSEGIFTFTFKTDNGITFKTTDTIQGFPHKAKQFIQILHDRRNFDR